MKQRIAVLGSTGSIGANTLDVIARHPDRFKVFALSAATQVELMLRQCAQFRPAIAVMADESAGRDLVHKIAVAGLATKVYWGQRALEEVASHESVDTVMAAIVGAAGLASCLAAASAGKRLLLANKEALVVGGDLFLAAVRQGGAKLLPIDSEHSAIFQSLPEDPATWDARVEKIILTASGGPFRTRESGTLRNVTPEEACAHPNWVMGRKISVDSATMMNKGLEVIEARWLFDVRPDQIEVVIHPESVVHSLVEYVDGSVIAQLGNPDMRTPIAFGLGFPERISAGVDFLDLARIGALHFEPPDIQRFPCLHLAREALAAGDNAPAVLNAANEVAVASFLAGTLGFRQIPILIEAVMAGIPSAPVRSLDDVLAADRAARERAEGWLRAGRRSTAAALRQAVRP
jgi:1-deoxy-D-xylulose-5-phosphate reductoisomerase